MLMKKNSFYVWCMLMLAGLLLIAGCGQGEETQGDAAASPPGAASPSEVSSPPAVEASSAASNPSAASPEAAKEDTGITFTDNLDRTVTLAKRPEKIVVLSPEILELMYGIGGTAAGRAEATGITPPAGAESVPTVGQMREVSLEMIVALKPDLVIGQPAFHKDLEETLTASGIPLALLKLGSLEEVHALTGLLGKLTDKEAEAKKALAELDERVEAVLQKLPEQTPTFVNLNVTPGAISIQRTDMAGLEIAKKMNMINAAEDMTTDKPDATTLPYSLEKLIEKNPDYVFLIIHGSKEAGEQQIKSQMESNPAWSSLKAVQEKKVIIMPSNLFLTNPGLKYDESMTYLGQYVYPESYGAPEAAPASQGQ